VDLIESPCYRITSKHVEHFRYRESILDRNTRLHDLNRHTDRLIRVGLQPGYDSSYTNYTNYVGRYVHNAIIQCVSHLRRIISVLSTWRLEFDSRVSGVGIMVVRLHCDRVLFEILVLPCHLHSTNAPYTITFIYSWWYVHNLCSWQCLALVPFCTVILIAEVRLG